MKLETRSDLGKKPYWSITHRFNELVWLIWVNLWFHQIMRARTNPVAAVTAILYKWQTSPLFSWIESSKQRWENAITLISIGLNVDSRHITGLTVFWHFSGLFLLICFLKIDFLIIILSPDSSPIIDLFWFFTYSIISWWGAML